MCVYAALPPHPVYQPANPFANIFASPVVVQEVLHLCPRLTTPISSSEADALRRQWYPSLARSEVEKEEYDKILKVREK